MMEESQKKDCENYDSAGDTELHRVWLRRYVFAMIADLRSRAYDHDLSKLQFPEKELYDKLTPYLDDLEYGSKEYDKSLEALGAALKHHYRMNRHHPEHFENGIEGMTLIDVVEMLCDWMAATKRHSSGNILRSIEVNKKRFGMSHQLEMIFLNTVKMMGWDREL